MPETSIILRTKNEEKWVGECLRRLGEQTYRDFEIVVIDSGSTDRTLEIVKKFDVYLGMARRIFKKNYAGGIRDIFSDRVIIEKPGMGVLGFTNAIIRKDLWDKHHFDESYGLGALAFS